MMDLERGDEQGPWGNADACARFGHGICHALGRLMEPTMTTTSDSGRVVRASRVLMLLSLGTLLWASWQRLASTHRARLVTKPEALPEPLQTWEGEGGSPVHDLAAS
jgi:hypothetical protein